MGARGVLRTLECDHVAFHCPGCATWHVLPVPPHPRAWAFNRDFDKPTFAPSILINVGGSNPTQPICHSFVRDGCIEFLNDCTHALVGRTVELHAVKMDP